MNRSEVGRKRLAMRLPLMRRRIMAAQHQWQLELFEAYQLAVETRERTRLNPSAANIFEQYVNTCLEIERDVVRYLRDTGFES